MTARTLPVDVGTIPTWTLSDRLRKARETARLSQTELADEIGVSRRSVSNYEVGASTPGRPVLLAWALRCGVPLTWLERGITPDGWAAGDSNPEPMGSKWAAGDSNPEPEDFRLLVSDGLGSLSTREAKAFLKKINVPVRQLTPTPDEAA